MWVRPIGKGVAWFALPFLPPLPSTANCCRALSSGYQKQIHAEGLPVLKRVLLVIASNPNWFCFFWLRYQAIISCNYFKSCYRWNSEVLSLKERNHYSNSKYGLHRRSLRVGLSVNVCLFVAGEWRNGEGKWTRQGQPQDKITQPKQSLGTPQHNQASCKTVMTTACASCRTNLMQPRDSTPTHVERTARC